MRRRALRVLSAAESWAIGQAHVCRIRPLADHRAGSGVVGDRRREESSVGGRRGGEVASQRRRRPRRPHCLSKMPASRSECAVFRVAARSEGVKGKTAIRSCSPSTVREQRECRTEAKQTRLLFPARRKHTLNSYIIMHQDACPFPALLAMHSEPSTQRKESTTCFQKTHRPAEDAAIADPEKYDRPTMTTTAVTTLTDISRR